NIWSEWNALTGAGWFFTNGVLSATCSMASPCTFAQVLSAFPNSGISQTQGAVMFKVGSGWPIGFEGNIDKFNLATSYVNTTYDFETPSAELNTEEFVAHSSDTYEGISVGFNAKNFKNVSSVVVDME